MGNLRATFFGQFKGYIFAVLGHFCFLLRLGGCGSQGLYNRSNVNPLVFTMLPVSSLHTVDKAIEKFTNVFWRAGEVWTATNGG